MAVKREEAEEVLQKSLARVEKEKGIKQRLMRGESTLNIYGFGEILKARGLTDERAWDVASFLRCSIVGSKNL